MVFYNVKNFVMIFFVSMITFVSVSFSFAETISTPLHKGICYVSWSKDRYASPYSDESLKKLAEVGASHVAIVVTQYQDKYDSTRIYPNDTTPTDKSLLHIIAKAHELGLKVLLKPHVDIAFNVNYNCSRSDICFYNDADWNSWFAGYKSFIMHYANLAKATNSEILCIGTELSGSTHKEHYWRSLIAEIRQIFSGELTYAANWDNYYNVPFWDVLDFVGIDVYFPLTEKQNPSLTQIKRGWEEWKSELRIFHKQFKKPIVFTEIGYPSASNAAITPWKNGASGNPKPEIQEKCYKAFFEVIWGCPWLNGVYWWRWSPNIYAGGKYNRRYTPQNKPAQKVIERYYKTST